MGDLGDYCLVGKPDKWLDVRSENLHSHFLTQPALVSNHFDRMFEAALWAGLEPRG